LIEKIVKPFITPIQRKILLPLKRLKNWPKLLAKWIKAKIKEVLGQKEITKASYVRVGNYYIAKKLIVIILLVVLIFYYFVFIKPPKFVNKLLNRKPAITVSASAPSLNYTGEAKVFGENGQLLFEGELVEGQLQGDGKRYSPEGVLIEEGTFEKGQLVQGSQYDENGVLVYTGSFANGMYEGEGTLYYPSGAVRYQGSFKAGKFDGQGRLYTEDGRLVYEGGFSNDVYAGEGTQYAETGDILYQGQFLAGKYNGPGKLLYPGGNIRFEGTFVNGQLAGMATEYFPAGTVKYAGEFLAGTYHGTGTLYDETGKIVYKGGFQNGRYHGSGELYSADGLLEYAGLFINGGMNGLGSWFSPDGTLLYRGEFSGGLLRPSAYLGLSPVEIEALLGKSSGNEVLYDPLSPEPALGEDALLAVAEWNPKVRMRYQQLRLSFIAVQDPLSESGAYIEEVRFSSGPVLDKLYKQLEELAQSESSDAEKIIGGEAPVYRWGGFLYQFELNADGKPVAGSVSAE